MKHCENKIEGPAGTMGYRIWILMTFLVGTFGLPKPASNEYALDHNASPRRMVGGSPAKSAPYMVALSEGMDKRVFVCGGSLVTTYTILTAAHCIDWVITDGLLSRSLLATVGTNRWNVSGESYSIHRGVIHPKYFKSNTDDIGLLITAEKVRLSDGVRTVPLDYDFIGPNVRTRVTGWGIIELQSNTYPSSLQQLTAKTVDGERCVAEIGDMSWKLYRQALHVHPETELCTFHSKNHGTCFGDSGSPLVLEDSEKQIGIVSWGLPCGLGVPDVFVRISAYKDWLQRHIR